MVLEGTVVNGVIVPDGPPPPEGTRVRVEFAADDDLWDELDDVPPPPTTETREEFLESLRQSFAEVAAGERGKSVEEVFDAIDREVAACDPDGYSARLNGTVVGRVVRPDDPRAFPNASDVVVSWLSVDAQPDGPFVVQAAEPNPSPRP